MSIPPTVDVSVAGSCTGRQRVNQTHSNLYAGGTGDFDFVYVYSVNTPTGISWELRTYVGPTGCTGIMIFKRDEVANDPVGSYSQYGGAAAATITAAV